MAPRPGCAQPVRPASRREVQDQGGGSQRPECLRSAVTVLDSLHPAGVVVSHAVRGGSGAVASGL